MLPKVVIIGRPNVGKSSLLNMLAGRRVSITDAMPGVTRDRIGAYVTLTDVERSLRRDLEMIDTGGHGVEDAQNLTHEVERQIAAGVAEANLILFVVDAQSGVVSLDESVAKLLRQAGCVPLHRFDGTATPVLLVANKVDGEANEPGAQEAARLGFGQPVMVSATSKYNRRHFTLALHDALQRVFGDPGSTEHAAADDGHAGGELGGGGLLVAIVGKRNAGKSTLVNALAGQERMIVSEIEGTTRDSVDVRFEIDSPRGKRTFTAIDTAGVRKRKSIAGDIEFYSYHRALRSIRRADVVLFLVDSTVPVSQVDKQLCLEMQKHFKPCVVVVNKWDLAEQRSTQEKYADYLDKELKGLSYAPIVFISAKSGEGVRDAAAMAVNLFEQAGHRVSTGELNRLIQQLYADHNPRMKHGRRPKIYYATQVAVHPPTISLFVNEPELFNPNYERYLLNRLRDELPFSEVPIRLLYRGRGRGDQHEQHGGQEPLPAEAGGVENGVPGA